tara:strand:- start:2608 stop:3921 length:1314 start_codon:yes stop_codon:yes gene_type:complete
MSLKLLLIQLNEINFDLVDRYLSVSKKSKFTNLRVIKEKYKSFDTYAENKYENLEPWIQWPSVHIGKDFNQHKIFRLGDIVNFPNEKQIFEIIEERGYKVGAISPMNAENRLKDPSYFIADPWTETYSDKSGFSKRLSLMLKQTVNENASGTVSFSSVITILETILRTLHYKKTPFLIKLIFSSFIKPWKKSLVLDYLIHMTHIYFLKKKSPNFSSIFFNAGAHIQHHYFYNAKHLKDLPKNPKWYVKPSSDPIEDMLEVYDDIISDYLKLCKNENQLIISTGLRQIPYNFTEFYYRLKDHSSFLNKIGIEFLKVLPRMTRDFEIIFDNNVALKKAKKILKNVKCIKNNLNIFNEIEERENSLFVSLTYFHEIKLNDYIIIKNNVKLNFFHQVVFVAIKNGMHDSKGYVFYSPKSNFKNPKVPLHVSKLHNMILSYF